MRTLTINPRHSDSDSTVLAVLCVCAFVFFVFLFMSCARAQHRAESPVIGQAMPAHCVGGMPVAPPGGVVYQGGGYPCAMLSLRLAFRIVYIV